MQTLPILSMKGSCKIKLLQELYTIERIRDVTWLLYNDLQDVQSQIVSAESSVSGESAESPVSSLSVESPVSSLCRVACVQCVC